MRMANLWILHNFLIFFLQSVKSVSLQHSVAGIGLKQVPRLLQA